LERQAFVADKKAIIFDMMIDIAEEYKIDIRKNSPPEQSTTQRTANNNVRL
jgi:dsDNA-binding SOS-regulon protein